MMTHHTIGSAASCSRIDVTSAVLNGKLIRNIVWYLTAGRLAAAVAHHDDQRFQFRDTDSDGTACCSLQLMNPASRRFHPSAHEPGQTSCADRDRDSSAAMTGQQLPAAGALNIQLGHDTCEFSAHADRIMIHDFLRHPAGAAPGVIVQRHESAGLAEVDQHLTMSLR
jgi:hypothetical protein